MTTTDDTPRVIRVDITPWDMDPKARQVTPVWNLSDRPNDFSWVVSPAVAKRLAAAVMAGAVFTDVAIKTNNDGQTYVGFRSRVMAKYANADLRRLGF